MSEWKKPLHQTQCSSYGLMKYSTTPRVFPPDDFPKAVFFLCSDLKTAQFPGNYSLKAYKYFLPRTFFPFFLIIYITFCTNFHLIDCRTLSIIDDVSIHSIIWVDMTIETILKFIYGPEVFLILKRLLSETIFLLLDTCILHSLQTMIHENMTVLCNVKS